MAFKDKESKYNHVVTKKGRVVTSTTDWWMRKAPNAYRYYCIHTELLTDECGKCEREAKKYA